MEINMKKTKIMIQKHNSKKSQNINFLLGNSSVDITNEYTYLGVKQTSNVKFSIAQQQLSEKAMHTQ